MICLELLGDDLHNYVICYETFTIKEKRVKVCRKCKFKFTLQIIVLNIIFDLEPNFWNIFLDYYRNVWETI